MNQIIVSGIIVLDTLFLLLLPVNAPEKQSRENKPECTNALQNTRNKIKQSRNVNIEAFERTNAPQWYQDYPQDRPFAYLISLSGFAAESFMHSLKLLNAISTDIVKNCPSISIVDFNVYQSDWTVTFGYRGEGKVEEFTQCVERNAHTQQLSSKFPWGYIFCP